MSDDILGIIGVIGILSFCVSLFIAMFIESMYIDIRKKHPSRMFYWFATLVCTLIIAFLLIKFFDIKI